MHHKAERHWLVVVSVGLTQNFSSHPNAVTVAFCQKNQCGTFPTRRGRNETILLLVTVFPPGNNACAKNLNTHSIYIRTGRSIWRPQLDMTAVCFMSAFCLFAGSGGGRGTDYCQMETFKASCAENEIIMMKSARYGRMRLGRCLTRNYYVGCSADVLPHLDTLCSGESHASPWTLRAQFGRVRFTNQKEPKPENPVSPKQKHLYGNRACGNLHDIERLIPVEGEGRCHFFVWLLLLHSEKSPSVRRNLIFTRVCCRSTFLRDRHSRPDAVPGSALSQGPGRVPGSSIWMRSCDVCWADSVQQQTHPHRQSPGLHLKPSDDQLRGGISQVPLAFGGFTWTEVLHFVVGLHDSKTK